jgi:5,10-methylenetetrahydromethanopterin reductase
MAAIGVSIEGLEPPNVLRALAAAAEDGGAATLWIACHLFRREPVALAAIAAAATQRIGVALMAMSPYSVHPVYAAMAAATLDEFFPGRVQLCLGTGAPRDLEAAGIGAPQPLRTLREAIAISRALFAGDTVRFDGERFRLSGRALANAPRPVSIVLAASGPRMLKLAGEAADGVLISGGASPEFVRWSLDAVRDGERAGGSTVRKIGLVMAAVADEPHKAPGRLKRNLAFVLRGAHHARNLALAGTQLDQVALAAAFAREDWAAVDALVTNDVLRQHTASGSPEEVREALALYRAVGLDEIVLSGLGDRDSLKRVLEALGGGRT